MVFDMYQLHGDEGEAKAFSQIRTVSELRQQTGVICEDQSLE